MKKINTILVVLLHFTFSTGVAIQHHFCGDLEVVNLYTTKTCCPDTGSQNSCCRNEASFFKVDDGYDVLTHSLDLSKHDIIVVANLLQIDPWRDVERKAFTNARVDLLRFKSSPPIYLTNRVFII